MEDSITNPVMDSIVLTQEWIETPDGWFTVGFNEPIGYILESELEFDKHYRCIKASFVKIKQQIIK